MGTVLAEGVEAEGKIQGYKHTTVDFLDYHNDSFREHMCNVMYLANTIHFENNIWTRFKHVQLKGKQKCPLVLSNERVFTLSINFQIVTTCPITIQKNPM